MVCVSNLIRNFTLYLKIDKDVSENTVESYLNDICRFIEYIKKPIEQADSSDIRSYMTYLTESGRKRSTIARNFYALRVFFDYLVNVEKLIKASPVEEIKIDTREKSLPKALSKSNINKILEVVKGESLKNRLIVELLYGLGGRVSEIVKLKVEDFDFNDCYVKLIGKGDKERHNPIHQGCIELLQLYLKANGITSGYIFPKKGNPNEHMDRASVTQLVKRIADRAGVDRNLVSAHVFRHSFATHLLDNGCDMALVQEYLGHEDISTTRIYAKVTRGKKQNSFNKFHPLAQ